MIAEKLKGASEYAPLVLRVALGIAFVFHGYGKLFGGLAGFQGMLEGLGFPAAGFFAILVAVVEFFGGIALIIGFGTRLAAMLIAVVMVVAILAVKISKGFSAFELDFMLLATALSVVFLGPGKLSIEDMMKKEVI